MPIVWSIVGVALGLGLNALVRGWSARGSGSHAAVPGWLLPVVTAAVLAWLAATTADPLRLIVAAVFAGVLLLLAALDMTYRIVPNIIVFPATLAAILIGPVQSPASSVIGALVGLAFFGALYWIGQRHYGSPPLGLGDVKLAMLLGALLGATAVWYALLPGMIGAGLTAAVLVVSGRLDRRATVPYGSFLALAGLVVLIVLNMPFR